MTDNGTYFIIFSGRKQEEVSIIKGNRQAASYKLSIVIEPENGYTEIMVQTCYICNHYEENKCL